MGIFDWGLRNKFKKMEANMSEINELYHSTNKNKITEEHLFEYLLLHPTGYTDNPIMKSPAAQKYFRMGYIKKGVNDSFKEQYKLTSFGLEQIELAMSLSLLS